MLMRVPFLLGTVAKFLLKAADTSLTLRMTVFLGQRKGKKRRSQINILIGKNYFAIASSFPLYIPGTVSS
jgi:hypothetical protein